MLPALDVGGDFYEYFLLDPDRLGIVIGDVSGKGVPAALFMAMSLTLLKAVARKGMPPGECLREVNAILTRDNRSEKFVTLFYGILDRRTGQLHFSNGGHNHPFIVPRNGDPRMLDAEAGGTFLGCFEDAHYETGQGSLEAGDVLVLYTDGVTEAMNSIGNHFSNSRLQAFLEKSGYCSPAEIVRGLIAAVQAFAHGARQSDDVTLVAVRYLAST
jgi:sigma-B regulation protein RsbU (phosphoserine phosphatase)